MLPNIVFFIIVDPDWRLTAEKISYVLRVLPSYCLGNGIMSISSREMYTAMYFKEKA